ncbi:MAG: hypothetical protein ACP5IL_14865 [Syntrophobacteraceae bacterium]
MLKIRCQQLTLCVLVGLALCLMPDWAHAGGVSVGFGFDVGSGYAPPPPVAYEPPPVVDAAPAPPVVVEPQAPPPVVVDRPPPSMSYGAPVVVEQRSKVLYYYPSYRPYYSHRVETRSEYWDGGRYREDYYQY